MFVFQNKIDIYDNYDYINNNNDIKLGQNKINQNCSYFTIDEIPLKYREDIYNNFFKSMKEELIFTIEKAKQINSDKILKIIKKKINDSINNNKQIFDKLRELEATESILSLGFFDNKVLVPHGIPITVSSEVEGYKTFFDIIRKYVFDYQGQWIEGVTGEDFKISNNKKIFMYLPLYCYIKKIFTNKSNQIDMTDLFSEIKLKHYCSPTLKKGKKEKETKSLPLKKGGNEKEENPIYIDYFQSSCYTKKTEELLRRYLNDKYDNNTEKIYFEKVIKEYLRNLDYIDLLPDNIKNKTEDKLNTDSLKNFTIEFIKIKVKEKGGDNSNIQYTDENEKRENNLKKYKIYFNNDDIIIKDPFLNINYTYKDLTSIYSPPEYSKSGSSTTKNKQGRSITKSTQIKKTYTNPYDILENIFKQFKLNGGYNIPSYLYNINRYDYQNIRIKTLRIFYFIIKKFDDIYIKILNDYFLNQKNNADEEKIKKIKKMYEKIIRSIDLEKDIEKSKKYEELKNKIEEMYEDIL